LGERVFLAPSAEVAGDVEVGDDASFWFHTAARGDVNRIRIGARTNVQDGAVLHVTHETHPLAIGDGVVIGHAAVLHGCTVEDGALIGIGARVLDGAVVETGAQVGAGAVVPPGTRIPAHHLALGIPRASCGRSPTASAPPSRRSPSATCGSGAPIAPALAETTAQPAGALR
jgi:carbonic anhydrase/acetyltransferase-like protein (isoleucine patch superfamily)